MAQMNWFPGYYEGVLLEEAHIRDPFFKITIPSLFQIKDQYEPIESTETPLDQSLIGTKSKDYYGQSYKSTNIILAANHTDYHYRLRGDIFKETMDGTDGITEPSDDPSPDGSPDDVIPHTHDIKKPMSLFNFTFENINNVKVPKGSRVYGFFINATLDRNGFVVTRIQGAVPLKKEVATMYVK